MQQLNFTVISDQFMVTAKEHSPCIWNMLYDVCAIRTKVTKLNQIRDRERLSENYTLYSAAVLLSTILFFKHTAHYIKVLVTM